MNFQLPELNEKTYHVTFERKGEIKERNFKAESEKQVRLQFAAFLPSAKILRIEEGAYESINGAD